MFIILQSVIYASHDVIVLAYVFFHGVKGRLITIVPDATQRYRWRPGVIWNLKRQIVCTPCRRRQRSVAGGDCTFVRTYFIFHPPVYNRTSTVLRARSSVHCNTSTPGPRAIIESTDLSFAVLDDLFRRSYDGNVHLIHNEHLLQNSDEPQSTRKPTRFCKTRGYYYNLVKYLQNCNVLTKHWRGKDATAWPLFLDRTAPYSRLLSAADLSDKYGERVFCTHADDTLFLICVQGDNVMWQLSTPVV